MREYDERRAICNAWGRQKCKQEVAVFFCYLWNSNFLCLFFCNISSTPSLSLSPSRRFCRCIRPPPPLPPSTHFPCLLPLTSPRGLGGQMAAVAADRQVAAADATAGCGTSRRHSPEPPPSPTLGISSTHPSSSRTNVNPAATLCHTFLRSTAFTWKRERRRKKRTFFPPLHICELKRWVEPLGKMGMRK